MTPTCPVPLSELDASDRGFHERRDAARGLLHRSRVLRLRARRGIRRRMAVPRARRPGTQPRRLLHDHDGRRAADRRPQARWRRHRALGGVPTPRDDHHRASRPAGGGVDRPAARGDGQLPHLPLPVPLLDVRPRRSPGRCTRDAAAHGLPRRCPTRSAEGGALERFRLREFRPRCGAARPAARRSRRGSSRTITSTR